jgi:hypothetical protein
VLARVRRHRGREKPHAVLTGDTLFIGDGPTGSDGLVGSPRSSWPAGMTRSTPSSSPSPKRRWSSGHAPAPCAERTELETVSTWHPAG